MHDLDLGASLQLQHDLEGSIVGALSTRRPILTHLNSDTSWLLSFVYPPNVKSTPGRSRYNILIDPWLQGPQSDVAGWFSTQWHAVKSSVQTIAEVNELLHETETLASRAKHTSSQRKSSRKSEENLGVDVSYIDAVVVSHEFTDHCHQSTLLEIGHDVPVFATNKAAALIRSWNHFDRVLDVATFTNGIDWRTTSHDALPSWLGISRLVTKSDALYYHSAIVICFENVSAPERAEAVIYTPHGVHAPSFDAIMSSQPSVQTLAFLHGLHDVSITLSKQLNLGAYNALKAQQILHSKYWVGTHDEVKIGGGLLAPFLRRKAHTLLAVLGKEGREAGAHADTDMAAHAKGVSYVDLGNGESLLLE